MVSTICTYCLHDQQCPYQQKDHRTIKVDNPYLVTILIRTPMFKWCMVRFDGHKNFHFDIGMKLVFKSGKGLWD